MRYRGGMQASEVMHGPRCCWQLLTNCCWQLLIYRCWCGCLRKVVQLWQFNRCSCAIAVAVQVQKHNRGFHWPRLLHKAAGSICPVFCIRLLAPGPVS